MSNKGVITGKNFVGGIAGHCGGSLNASAGIISCYKFYFCGSINYAHNSSDITGENGTAGIIGHNKEDVTRSAYTVGKVDGDENVGIVIGQNYNTTMADYYYLQSERESFGINDGGGFATAKTESEMKDDDFVKSFGEAFVLVKNFNEGFPLLKWEIAE